MRNDVVRRGRLTGERSGEMMHFLSSMEADRHLADADVLVDIAHVMMLHKQRIIEPGTTKDLLSTLLRLYDDGIPESVFGEQFEDIHAGIESFLIEGSGEETGGRLHSGRSRNDEVAACLRIRIREDILRQLSILCRLRGVLLSLAADHQGTVMPGFTHFQHAQPTTLAHYLLSYEQAFSRDFERLMEAFPRVNRSPLGAAAFASTGFPVNREYTADLLGFDGVIGNTMDAVASRDFALEVLADLSLLMVTVSRLCEDLILWSSAFIRFVSLDDAFCSTSSIMPQKKNPDSAEIMRAKTGSVLGAFMTSAAIVKALPMSYNRDLQELTPSLIRGVQDAKHTTGLLADMLASASFDTGRMREEAGRGNATATDLADMLVRRFGFPFRTAHSIVGRAVQKGDLILANLDEAAIEITGSSLSSRGLSAPDIAASLDVDTSLQEKRATGGPAKVAVAAALEDRKKQLALDRDLLEKRKEQISASITALIREARRIAS
ncbi:MAG: argininosuccinate lyase [Methanomicrobiales archaeon]|nr:argininosuccinate lyase [Methanomicrobiales archaeon]NYT20544.1 argininosuccinate lyase [Methanomicrobiales archaeon]